MSQRKKELIEELKDKEYRDEYVSSSIDVGVAFQIRALREQREWNQTRFAKEAGMQQARISTLENPSHSPTLETLKKLAAAFDVGLIVKFVPFSELVKRELNLPNESLEVPSFDEDSYFQYPTQTVHIDQSALRAGIASYGLHQGIGSFFNPSQSPLRDELSMGSKLGGSSQEVKVMGVAYETSINR